MVEQDVDVRRAAPWVAQVFTCPKPRIVQGVVTPEELLDGVRADYEERMYLWTGDIDPNLYDEDCTFTDPTLSFKGLATLCTRSWEPNVLKRGTFSCSSITVHMKCHDSTSDFEN